MLVERSVRGILDAFETSVVQADSLSETLKKKLEKESKTWLTYA